MELIFLGGFFPKELLKNIRDNSIGAIANANNALQWAYINGLKQIYPNLRTLSLPQIGAFPFRYRKLFFRGIKTDEKNLCLSFVNLLGIKHYFRYLQAKKGIRQFFTPEEETYIIIYDLQVPFLKATVELKSKYQNLKIILIVPDLHGYTGEAKSFLHTLWNQYEEYKLNKLYSGVDYFVLLSKHMKEKLPVKNRPCQIIEGIYEPSLAEDNILIKASHFEKQEKILFYSGALDQRNGILNLLEAFRMIPYNNYKLIICGDGELKTTVINLCHSDRRIIYKGQLPREEVLQLQKQSTLLINPRTPSEIFTKYSFPSKTMEYFASGIPVLMYKLEGIPEEYYQFCYTLQSSTPQALKEKILEICNQPSPILWEKGLLAKNFIFENKTPLKQCRKLSQLIG